MSSTTQLLPIGSRLTPSKPKPRGRTPHKREPSIHAVPDPVSAHVESGGTAVVMSGGVEHTLAYRDPYVFGTSSSGDTVSDEVGPGLTFSAAVAQLVQNPTVVRLI